VKRVNKKINIEREAIESIKRITHMKEQRIGYFSCVAENK